MHLYIFQMVVVHVRGIVHVCGARCAKWRLAHIPERIGARWIRRTNQKRTNFDVRSTHEIAPLISLSPGLFGRRERAGDVRVVIKFLQRIDSCYDTHTLEEKQ